LLTAARRQSLLPALGRWGTARAVGHATPVEIDELGIVAALRLAGTRALQDLGVDVDVVLLDGSHDWLTGSAAAAEGLWPLSGPTVVTQVKADQTCTSVAAASVLAKCERDALMVTHARTHPDYGWHRNKGYSAPDHVSALREHGPSPLHRMSWRLPGVDDPNGHSRAEMDERWSIMEA
jgi:ribonuclease HII